MDYSTCFYTIATLYMLGASLMISVVSAIKEAIEVPPITFFLVVLLWPIVVLAELIKKSYLFIKN